MLATLNTFQIAQAMARHAGERQALIAQNISHSDTPGYKARDLASFQARFENGQGSGNMALNTTRPAHIDNSLSPSTPDMILRTGAEPNGNSVSLEEEMLKAATVAQQHKRALAIYRSSLNILRASLGKV